MKIAILTLGTRGDVQPYAVVGHALKQRGHQVTISTAKQMKISIDNETVLQYIKLEIEKYNS